MGWTIVATLFFGLYGFMVHPLVGLIGLVAPILTKVGLDKNRESEAATYMEWKTRSEANERRKMEARLVALDHAMRARLNERMNNVLQTFRTTVKTSPMGLPEYRRFDREILRFLEASLTEGDVGTLAENGLTMRQLYERELCDDLHATLEAHLERQTAKPTHFINGSPVEFEKHCAERFRACGWRVTETPASGDHGVDVIAERGDQTIAVQCKLYSQPVGNSAVQEVAAGKVHYGAKSAIVIATSGFTAGAQVLARSNQVALIHPDEIASRFGPSSPPTTQPSTSRHLDWSPKRKR